MRLSLSYLSNMTRDQKERYVIELHTQDKTVREIIQLVHMSPRDVVAIIDEYKKEVERENGQVEENDYYDIKSKLKTTQAFRLFSEGKTPIDVVIDLDLPPDEVREMYRQYLGLKDMHELVGAYDRMENYLPSKNVSVSTGIPISVDINKSLT